MAVTIINELEVVVPQPMSSPGGPPASGQDVYPRVPKPADLSDLETRLLDMRQRVEAH
jgi:hypothetical protein